MTITVGSYAVGLCCACGRLRHRCCYALMRIINN